MKVSSVLIVLFFLLSTSFAEEFTTAAAQDAKTKFEQAEAKLESQLSNARQKLVETYINDLTVAGKTAFGAGQIDEATRIVNLLKTLKDEKSTLPSTLQKLKAENAKLKRQLVAKAKPKQVKIPREAVEFGGHSYVLILDMATVSEAIKFCRSAGGHLLRIDSRREYDFAVGLIRSANQGACWVDGSDSLKEGEWVYGNGAGLPPELPWAKGDPSNTRKTQHVLNLNISKGGLNDWWGYEKSPFIIEWDR